MAIEACVGSVRDAREADACGVDRIEISENLEADGVTPGKGFVEALVAEVRVPIVVLVRARVGDFRYDQAEVAQMCRDAAAFAALGVEGVAIGALRADGSLDADAMRRMAEAARTQRPDITLVCHRAFDCVPDLPEAVAQLESMGFDRVLTSGGRSGAPEGSDIIARLQRATALELVPAGGVRAQNIRQIVETTGCRSIHGTFRVRAPSADGAVRLDPEELRSAVAELRRG